MSAAVAALLASRSYSAGGIRSDPPSPAAQAASSPGRQRLLIARKIVSNLFFLKTHPHASPALRQVMADAHECWVAVCNAGGHDRTPVMATELCAAMPLEAASLLH